eukprot:jgi/Mesen1/9214/ME000591S08546
MDYEGVASIALLPSGNLSGHFVDSSSKKCFGLMGTEFVCERECSHGEDYRLLRLTVIDFAAKEERTAVVERKGHDAARLSTTSEAHGWDVGVIAAATSAAAGGPPGNDKCPIVHFECAMLKADAEAEAHLRRFQPALLNKHAVGACVAPSAPAHPPADGAAGSRSSDRQDVEATSPAGTVQLSPVGSREAARELDACGRWEEQVSAPLTWSEEAEGLPRSGEASETTGAAENQEIAEESIDHPNASPGYATAGAPHAFSDGHAGCFLDHSFGSTGGEEEPAMGANGGSLLSRACPPQILPRFDDPFQQILREELQREGLHAKNEREDAELATVVREGSASACSPSGWEETGEGWRAKKRPKES